MTNNDEPTYYAIIGRTRGGNRKVIALYKHKDEALAFAEEGETVEPRFD